MDARLLSFEILLEFEKSNRWLRNVRNDYFGIKPTPRLVRERTTVLTNEVVKWQRLLDTIINANLHKPSVKLKFPVRNLLRLGVYELLMDEFSPDYAVVDSYVKISRRNIGPHITGLINAVLRKISGSGKYVFNGKFPENIAVGLSYPNWLVEKWGTYYGMDDTIRLCEYFNGPSQMMVRRNWLKIEHDVLVQKLLDDKIHRLALGHRLQQRDPIRKRLNFILLPHLEPGRLFINRNHLAQKLSALAIEHRHPFGLAQAQHGRRVMTLTLPEQKLPARRGLWRQIKAVHQLKSFFAFSRKLLL